MKYYTWQLNCSYPGYLINDANCISCITTPSKITKTQPQKPSFRGSLSPTQFRVYVVRLRATPPRPPTSSLRSPNTLAPSTKAGFRNRPRERERQRERERERKRERKRMRERYICKLNSSMGAWPHDPPKRLEFPT